MPLPGLPAGAFAFLLFFAASFCTSASAASTNPDIERYLAAEALRLDARFLDGVTNREQFEAKRPALRREYFEALGLWPLPERTPLQPQITRVLKREEGFRVENVHFQSRPHLYVTGNLYLPADAQPGAKLPAILYVCGHSARPRDGNKTAFQHHGMWFATHGYACLIIDSLQLGEIAAIHHGTYRYDRWWWQARGYTPAAVECWNGIRAIDYLQSRPEVDPERIGVTGISGGGAATFWIAAADERVKVAVPVSGMSDLQDYVGEKVVNGHCDCMFLINTFQWPWTHIAALVAPRPMLFENSGHDTIFPMPGNERIRTRLERLYGFYTNRTERLFDIGVTAGGHDDKPELRLMAYRWLNRFLKNQDDPVTEPELRKIDGKMLRAFPGELPSDEINTKIDELFVPMATNSIPATAAGFTSWRDAKHAELDRLVFRGITPLNQARPALQPGGKTEQTGELVTEPGMAIAWRYLPSRAAQPDDVRWIAILGDDETGADKPGWLSTAIGDASVLLVWPRNTGSNKWSDPAPFFVQRSLPLLGRTVDTGRLVDALAMCRNVLSSEAGARWNIIGRGRAGVIAGYAALLEPRIAGITIIDPPRSHRDGPIFLNVLRVLDIPDALGMLAPRPLAIATADRTAFERTSAIYRAAGGALRINPVP